MRETYVANGIVSNIDAVLEQTLSTRLTRSGNLVGADDLVWSCLNDVLSVEVEEHLVLFPVVVLLVPLVVEVLLAVLDVGLPVRRLVVGLSSRSSNDKSRGQESEESGCGEVHLEYVLYDEERVS